ncbi:MAG: SRPBCC family protein [Pseudomonadota bacterium]|nr:SRPBCC family protein [Pseudomonadota bacterium]
MAKVSMKSEINMDPDELWKLIGQFNTLPDWHPAVSSSKLEDDGRVRQFSLFGGGEIVERLEQIEEGDRLYRYSIVSSPLPVANYTTTLRVKDDGSGKSVLEWSSEFDPSGASEIDASSAILDVYQAGMDNLRKMYGGG